MERRESRKEWRIRKRKITIREMEKKPVSRNEG